VNGAIRQAFFLIPFGKGSAKYWLIGRTIFVAWLGIYMVYESLKFPNFLNIVIYYFKDVIHLDYKK